MGISKSILHRLAALATATAFLFCTVLLFTNPAQAEQARQVLHNHVRAAVASGQAPLVGTLPPSQRLNLAIMLPLRNQSELTSLLERLYDPTSADYGHYLSVEQFTRQFGRQCRITRPSCNSRRRMVLP